MRHFSGSSCPSQSAGRRFDSGRVGSILSLYDNILRFSDETATDAHQVVGHHPVITRREVESRIGPSAPIMATLLGETPFVHDAVTASGIAQLPGGMPQAK